MSNTQGLTDFYKTSIAICLAYVLCHGLTAFVVTPLQSIIMPEITVFASLMYLPHGVRVLATWAYGWKAVPILAAGGASAAWLFTPTQELTLLEPVLIWSILVGAASAFVAFEVVRFFGYDFYCGQPTKLRWKGMIGIGLLASVINSIGQTLVYSEFIVFGNTFRVQVSYATGDLIGLIVCMLGLMLVFRWHRALESSPN
ncbi:hypothetical protein ACMAZE_15080 [Pseudopelagicola sp. nBUS_20]|uniref:hypothetical protein n=1 Tax=Pseudopelagicola sp. nBUS_20 TaxID=3395317 RepID=UPI003EBD1EDD